jgi:hypothetical protein
MPHVPRLIDFVSSGVLPDAWLAEDSCREQSGPFPYVDSTPQHTPHKKINQNTADLQCRASAHKTIVVDMVIRT